MTDPRAIPLRWLLALCLLLPPVVSCSDPTGPRHTNIEIARATWVSASHSDYSFEIATESSWFPKSGYTRVRVESGQAVEAINPDGEPVAFTMTIDTLWQWVLAEHESGSLRKAEFDRRGVPVEVNWGPWELDGGVAFYVRRFRTD